MFLAETPDTPEIVANPKSGIIEHDGFEWNLKGKPNKGYKVINGSKSLQTDFVSDGRTKKKILEIT